MIIFKILSFLKEKDTFKLILTLDFSTK